MDEIRQKLQRKEITVGDAIVKALPLLRDRVQDDTLTWLACELQGYPNGIEFYQGKATNLPEYRVVTGALKLMDPTGAISDFNHPFASRGKYFLSAPVSWLEEFASLPGTNALADCPDLTSLLMKGQGNVVCEFTKPQLNQVITHIRQRLISLLDKMAQKAQ